MPFLAEVTYFVKNEELNGLRFKVENGILMELPQFPGLLCKVVGLTPRLTLRTWRIVQLSIADFYRDDGT